MATNTLPTFSASTAGSPLEPRYFIRFPHEGTEYCVGFDSLEELKDIVAEHCCYPGEYIISFAEESLEWDARPPVAEAVAGFEPNDDGLNIARGCAIALPTGCALWVAIVAGITWGLR